MHKSLSMIARSVWIAACWLFVERCTLGGALCCVLDCALRPSAWSFLRCWPIAREVGNPRFLPGASPRYSYARRTQFSLGLDPMTALPTRSSL